MERRWLFTAHALPALLAAGALFLALPARAAGPADTHEVFPGQIIQDAIDAADPGDLVLVHAGIYTEHITMRDGVSIYGQGGSATTIHGGYSGPTPTVFMSSIWAGTVLSGVQVTGGGTGVITTSTQDGGCIAIWYAAPTIVNTWVQGCTARNGGGVFVFTNRPPRLMFEANSSAKSG